MSLDATFLLALAMLTASALAVGVSGWVLFVRDHRASATARAAGGAHPASTEEG
jgi:hypothetical protein